MKILWKQTGNDPNDLIAKVEKDTLRVERMNKHWVWWCIYVGNEHYQCYDFDLPQTKTIEDAKKQCEEKYKEVKK